MDVGSMQKVWGYMHSGAPSQAKTGTMQAERGTLDLKLWKSGRHEPPVPSVPTSMK